MSALGEAILHRWTCLSSHPRHKMPTAYQPQAQYRRPEGERTPGRLPGATPWAQGSPVHSHTTPKGTHQGRPPTRDRGLLASLLPPLLTNLHLKTCPSPVCRTEPPLPLTPPTQLSRFCSRPPSAHPRLQGDGFSCLPPAPAPVGNPWLAPATPWTAPGSSGATPGHEASSNTQVETSARGGW